MTTGSKGVSEPSVHDPNSASVAGELHCKRCGEAMTTLGMLASDFANRSRFKLFRCLACGFYDWVKA